MVVSSIGISDHISFYTGDPIEEYNIVGLIKLVDKLKTELIHGDTYYRPVFKKILNIDYIAVILGTIGTKLSEDLNNILKKVNMALCKVEGESSRNFLIHMMSYILYYIRSM